MSDKIYLGRELAGFESSPAFAPYSKVILWMEDEAAFIAGDDSGRTLEATLPWATQKLAEEILANIKGFSYQPMTGTDAIWDPAAELGDGITAGGIYGPLAAIDTVFDQLYTADISAPHEEEIDHEYPYVAPRNREINRKFAQNRSYIEKTAEEINLVVEGLQDEFTKVSVTLDGLTVSGPNGETYIKDDAIQTGSITADKIDSTDLHVKSANIDGMLTAEQIVLTGSISWGDLNQSVQNTINSAGGISAAEATTLITDKLVQSPTLRGASIFGGLFSDLGGQNYITMYTEDDQYGSNSFLNHYSSIYSTSLPLMSMGYRNLGYDTDQWLMQVRNRTVMLMGPDDVLHLWGVWDFSGATVTGLSVVFG